MLMDKKLSIILPVYNAEGVLEETLDRIFGQSFIGLYPGATEVIAVNDASTDCSESILMEAQAQHPELLRLISLSENRGPGGARNAALNAASGEYIGMIDADDLPDPGMYEKLWNASYMKPEDKGSDERYDIVDCAIYSQAENTALSYTPPELCGVLNDMGRARLISEAGCPVTRIYRRELIERYHIRFREQVLTMEDQDFLCEILARASSVNLVPEVLYTYRDTPDSATKRDAETNFFEETIRSVLATYDRLKGLPNYEGIREGAEYYYLCQCILAKSVVDAYRSEGVITGELAEQMNRMLRQVVAGTGCRKSFENQLICEKYGMDEAHKIEEMLQREP